MKFLSITLYMCLVIIYLYSCKKVHYELFNEIEDTEVTENNSNLKIKYDDPEFDSNKYPGAILIIDDVSFLKDGLVQDKSATCVKGTLVYLSKIKGHERSGDWFVNKSYFRKELKEGPVYTETWKQVIFQFYNGKSLERTNDLGNICKPSISEIAVSVINKKPVIVGLGPQGTSSIGHSVVIVGVDNTKNSLIYFDPSDGKLKVGNASVADIQTAIAVTEVVYLWMDEN